MKEGRKDESLILARGSIQKPSTTPGKTNDHYGRNDVLWKKGQWSLEENVSRAQRLKIISIVENLKCDCHEKSRRGRLDPASQKKKLWFTVVQQLTRRHSERQS